MPSTVLVSRIFTVRSLSPLPYTPCLSPYLFPESLDEFLESGNFSSELILDVRVPVSEGVDSGFEVQLQFVEILAISFQTFLRFKAFVLFLKDVKGELVEGLDERGGCGRVLRGAEVGF